MAGSSGHLAASPMPALSSSELKQLALQHGLEIYRTLTDRVVLADRVRENLIMDSGIALLAGEPARICVTFRAQSSDFFGETEERLAFRARALGAQLSTRGYAESGTQVVPIHDPADRARRLDTWVEVQLSRDLDAAADLGAELRSLLALERVARP